MKLKLNLSLLTMLAVAVLLSITACKDDDDGGNDLTAKITGTYNGTYEEGTSGSSISTDDVETDVTKESNSKIKVVIKVLPGLASVAFTAEMTDETHFTVPQFTLFDDDLMGSGSLENDNTLKVDLDKVNEAGAKITYEGLRQ